MNQTKQAESALPSPEDAVGHLMQNVHGQVFFTKLAARGHQPRNQKEAQDLLELSGKLRVVAQDPRVKAAEEGGSAFSQANSALDGVLQREGLDNGIKQAAAQEHDTSVLSAVEQLAQDPDIYNSVLSIKAAEAEQLAAQLGITPAEETTEEAPAEAPAAPAAAAPTA